MPRRPPHKVTDETRRQVEHMRAFGLTVEEIALILSTSVSTVKRRYKAELTGGLPKANMRTANTLFRLANGAPAEYDDRGNLIRAEQAPDFRAVKFWLQTRARWSTVHEVNVTGQVETKLDADVQATLQDLRKLSPDDLRNLETVARALEEARAADAEEDAPAATNRNGKPPGQATPQPGAQNGSLGGPSRN